MTRTLITHVGTSLLSDDCNSFRSFIDRKWLKDGLNSGQDGADYVEQAVAHLIAELSKAWAPPRPQRYKDSPAEIASLSMLGVQPDDRVVLFHSETVDGAFCANVLARVLTAPTMASHADYPCHSDVAPVAIRGLRISGDSVSRGGSGDGADMFVRAGLKEYVQRAVAEYKSLKGRPQETDGSLHNLLFNITAGYKGMIPIARDLVLLLAAHSRVARPEITCEVCYLYQPTAKDQLNSPLIRYPALPISYDLDLSEDMQTCLAKAATCALVDVDVCDASGRMYAHYRPYVERSRMDRRHMCLTALGEVVWALHGALCVDKGTRPDPEYT